MDTDAVITVIDHSHQPRRFHTTCGSPEHQIPHLADFLTFADDTDTALTIAAYRDYVTSHPGTLPGRDVTGQPDDELADLAYRYRLTLDDDTRCLELVAHDVRENRVVATVGRANVYGTAAAMCDLLAERDHHHNHPDDAAPRQGTDRWRQAAAEYRRRADTPRIWAAGATLAADFTPASHTEPHPFMRIAGVLVLAYLDEQAVLHVSVDLDETADRLVRPDGTVALRVSVSGTDIFHA